VPLGEEQTPEEIGSLTAFLCGAGAASITGQVISVDGGVTLRSGAIS
jgi:3-oxoacyl-[acyl-carrier protein] reductase